VKIDPTLLNIFSDLCINLSAGWFGSIVILPTVLKRPKVKWWILTGNIAAAILAIVVAYLLRRLS